MCFAPQRRALFRHLNFQQWSGLGVFYTFWLRSVFRATTACTFSTSQVLQIHTKPPRLRFFVRFQFDMCFAPQRRAIFHLSSGQLAPHPLTSHSLMFRDFPTFSHTWIFFLDFLFFECIFFHFSSLTLPTSAFDLSIWSDGRKFDF